MDIWRTAEVFKKFGLDTSAFTRAFEDAIPLPVSINTMAWKSKEEDTLKQVWLGKLTPEEAVREIEIVTNKALEKEAKARNGSEK